MKIYTRIEWAWNGSEYEVVACDSEDYSGPVISCTGAEAAPAVAESGKAASNAAVMNAAAADAVASGAPEFLTVASQNLAPTSFLGLNGGQWLQQGALQGGSMLMKKMAADQVDEARQRSYDRYNQLADENAADVEAAFGKALTPWDKATLDQNLASMRASGMSEFDATRPQYFSTNEGLPESTPDVVKSDIARRTTEARTAARNRYSALNDMNSFSNLLGLNAINAQDQAAKIKAAQGVSKTNSSQLSRDLQFDNNAGNLLSGAGDMTSSMGNLLLASQLSKKG